MNRKITGVNGPERVFRKKKEERRKKERKSRNLVAVCIYIYMTTGDKRATFSLTASISSIV